MTTENKSIWHTPDENPNKDIKLGDTVPYIVFYAKDGVWLGFREPNSDRFYLADESDYFTIQSITKWAYIDDLVPAREALDVAIDALQIISANAIWDSVDTSEHAEKAIKSIRKIMKRNK